MFSKNRKSLIPNFALILALLGGMFGAVPARASAATHYVKWDASGANNGTSWTDAFTDLQSALSAAVSGNEIWVAAGTYKPTTGTDRTISFTLKNDVAIYGGFAGTETLRDQRDYTANFTILSGDIGIVGLNNNGDNSYHVVVGSNTNNSAVLDGFIVTLGNANGSFPSYSSGGGMYSDSGSPMVSNVTFSSNSATFGGGMFNGREYGYPNGSNPILTNVSFIGNSAMEGGGMENMNYSSPSLTNVTFRSNTAIRSGGGMINFDYSSPSLTDVTFSFNTASVGGGIMNWVGDNPTLTNVTFSYNSVSDWGGGMANYQSSPSLTNVTFAANYAVQYGGGMYNEYNSNPSLTNVTFSGNSAITGGV